MPATNMICRCSSPGSGFSPTSRTAIRLCMLILLLGWTAVPLAAATPSAKPDRVSWADLEARGAALETRLREARVRLDPRATFAAESTYARFLAHATQRLTDTPPESLLASARLVDLIERVLVTRDPALRGWMRSAWRDCGRLDPSGRLCFWCGIEAFESQRWDQAVACFSGHVAPWLRLYADWLRVSALEELSPLAAAETALSIARAAPGHPLAQRLVARALVLLLQADRQARCARVATRWLESETVEGESRAVGETVLAELARRAGSYPRCLAHFERASEAASGAPGAERWRREQALWLLEAPKRLSSRQFTRFVEMASNLGGAAAALPRWERGARGLTSIDSLRSSAALLRGLYGQRDHGPLLRLCDALAASSPGIRQLAQLHRARVARRHGDLPALVSAYAAAAAGGAEGDASREARAATALWELGREWEDARRWHSAARTYRNLARRYPDARDAWDARLRMALCLHRAGEDSAGLAILDAMRETAAPDKRAGPALWSALLRPPQARPVLLAEAAGESNPGYFALRAAWSLRLAADAAHPDPEPRPGSPGALGIADSASMALPTSDPFWVEICREIRDAQSWDWPASERFDNVAAGRGLLQMIEGAPTVRSAQLLLANGYRGWARALWSRLAGWEGCSGSERAALLRALGDFGGALRLSFLESDRRARYPVAYTQQIEAVATRFDFSPAFLMAVMRQESLMDPIARSPAGARGLMQLMPATARRMADSLGWGDRFDLIDPADNLPLGAAHLAELWHATGGSLPVALAAYNGGLENAVRWIESGMSWDDYIERIAYGETRHFVKSVLMHYWFYRCCYAGESVGAANADRGGGAVCRCD
ncbi:MAG: transglycosylase SLT domain-containing protein [Candidatus Eisenbacteria bacterium]|nr:transglycosylase SLT domain-containing protein [Candidatus Eisenbacteria bacterium]